MEIVDLGELPLDVVEVELPEGVEVEDLGSDIPMLPGALEAILEPEVEVEDSARPKTWEEDNDHGQFIIYMTRRVDEIPQHSGQTTVGCEKAIAFLKRLDKEISRAVQSDEDNVIDEGEAEGLRDKINDYISKLDEALERLMSDKRPKKKASVRLGKNVVARMNDGVDIGYYIPVIRDDEEELLKVTLAEPTPEQVQLFTSADDERSGLKKEGQTAKIVLIEDPFLHSITRILINSHVSAGRNIEEVYDNLKKKYAFTSREELSIQELLLQKGMPIFKDFGRIGEEADPADGKGVEFSTTYQS